MDLIIQTDFLEQFFILYDEDNDTHTDFKKFINKVSDFTIVADINLFDLNVIDENPFWRILLDKAKYTNYLPSIGIEIETVAFYKTGSIFKLFCIDKDDIDCLRLEKTFGYVYFNFHNLIAKWKLFHSDRENISIPITSDTRSVPRFDNWSKMSLYQHPICSLVIFDKYALADNPDKPIQDNLFELFKHLLPDIALNEPIQILILIDAAENSIYNKNLYLKHKTAKDRLIWMGQKLTQFFSDNFNLLQVNISIVHYNKKIHGISETLHDREIYTNYFYTKIGAGIDLINTRSNITKGSSIDFQFLFDNRYRNTAFTGLRSIKAYINNAQSYPNVLEHYNYSGNKLIDDPAIL